MAYMIDIDGAEFHARRVADSKVDGREVFATFGQARDHALEQALERREAYADMVRALRGARAADAVDWPPPGKPWSRERFDATGPVA